MNDTTIDFVDGSVYAYQVSPDEGLVYVTIAGPDEDEPMIIGFDRTDLDVLKLARKELKSRPAEPDPGAVLRILAASRSDRFVWDRVEYRFDLNDGKWVAWGRVDTECDCAPDGEACQPCNGVHNPTAGVTFVTSRNWTTPEETR